CALLLRDGLQPRDVAPHLAHARCVLELAGRPLEAQIELLLLQLEHLFVELLDVHASRFADLHDDHSLMRWMKRVLIGSLAAARSSASRAVCTGTPSISNRMRPGLMRQTHSSGVPLPLPMRTSIGFFDTGRSGKMRIQTRRARFMWRVMARRAASIWRAVTRSGSSALRPNSPNVSDVPDVATPRMRPLCALRNLVRLGCSMVQYSRV